MSDFDGMGLFISTVFILGFLVGGLTVYAHTKTSIMESAYEHGVAKQCLGKKGYHFTCDK